jgi:DNA-directed RNA polymerase specialized sigma24 family protein
LIRLLDWWGVGDAEGWADETLNRVARRLSAGACVCDVSKYAAGVARLVAREARRKSQRMVQLDEKSSGPWPEADRTDIELAVLDECIEALPVEERKLLLEYYTDGEGSRIERRQAMARRLGIEMNALRIRIHRSRARLEVCFRRRLLERRPETTNN